MNTRTVGYVYLFTGILIIFFNAFFAIFVPGEFIEDNDLLLTIISESILFIPAAVLIMRNKCGTMKMMHIKRPKITTILLSFVYLICCYPAVAAVNMITVAITSNTAIDMAVDEIEQPFWVIFLTSSIIAPVVEELIFRGVIMGGLRTTGRIFTAIALQGLLFGLIHMNLNQFSYAVVLGIMWGLLVEASGSIFTSIFCHFMLNGFSTISVYMSQDEIYKSQEFLWDMGIDERMQYVIAGVILSGVSVLFIVLAILLLKAIAANEGRTGCFENIFRKKLPAEKYGSLFSPALITGIVLNAVMIVSDIILAVVW